MSEFVIERIEEFANALLPSMGLELVEVQFRREGHGWVLRLFIDCEEGVTIDHCADVSRELSDYLDVEELIDHAYHLEVSSPGLERSLTKEADYHRFVGRKVKIKVREEVGGRKAMIGTLVRVHNEGVELLLEDTTTVEVMFANIRKARLTL